MAEELLLVLIVRIRDLPAELDDLRVELNAALHVGGGGLSFGVAGAPDATPDRGWMRYGRIPQREGLAIVQLHLLVPVERIRAPEDDLRVGEGGPLLPALPPRIASVLVLVLPHLLPFKPPEQVLLDPGMGRLHGRWVEPGLLPAAGDLACVLADVVQVGLAFVDLFAVLAACQHGHVKGAVHLELHALECGLPRVHNAAGVPVLVGVGGPWCANACVVLRLWLRVRILGPQLLHVGGGDVAPHKRNAGHEGVQGTHAATQVFRQVRHVRHGLPMRVPQVGEFRGDGIAANWRKAWWAGAWGSALRSALLDRLEVIHPEFLRKVHVGVFTLSRTVPGLIDVSPSDEDQALCVP
mmetsp:Transcript_108681/g.188006  ORF Transcript_108681/g.188006 Transcript_108681/m.188006 type:complete len:353 (+) Transcript_108681:907-1965(+)